MGLLAEMDIKKWGFPEHTPQLHINIDYTGVGTLFGNQAEEAAKGSCPVDTGYLRSSIKGSGDRTTGRIEATAEYAQYVEYGTWKMAAQEYFTPAVEQAAQAAFQMAMQKYQEALRKEEIEMQRQMAQLMQELKEDIRRTWEDFFTPIIQSIDASSSSSSSSGNGDGSVKSLTQTVGGVEFNREGKVSAGLNWMMTQPGMWRENTSFHSVAETRSANLQSYRTRAMENFRKEDSGMISATMITGSHSYGGGSGGGAVRFGTSVGMATMGSIISSGGSYLSGLAGGMAVGGLATLAGLALGDVFGDGGPQFTMPEITIT